MSTPIYQHINVLVHAIFCISWNLRWGILFSGGTYLQEILIKGIMVVDIELRPEIIVLTMMEILHFHDVIHYIRLEVLT